MTPVALALLAAHFLGDFLLQSTTMVRRKAEFSARAFLVHGLVHATLAWVLVARPQRWEVPLAVFVAHVGIDLLKEIARRTEARHGRLDAPRQLWLFGIDQLAHLASLYLIARLILPLDAGPRLALDASAYPRVLILVIGYLLTVRVGSIVVGLAVARYQPEMEGRVRHDAGIMVENRGLEGGGQMIGALERTLTFFFVVLDFYSGIGFLLAAKSILRFGDVHNAQQRREAEYIIIGTLMSFAWALGAAALTQWALVTFA